MGKRLLQLLSVKDVVNAIDGKAPDGRKPDGGGLYLKVRAGSVIFVFMSAVGGKRSEISLGSVLKLGAGSGSSDSAKIAKVALDQARLLAAQYRQKLADGSSPASFVRKVVADIVADGDLTFDQIVEHYIDYKKITDKQNLSELTKLERHFVDALHGDGIKDLSKTHAKLYRDTRLESVSISTVKREVGVLKSIFNVWNDNHDDQITNPFIGLKIEEKEVDAALNRRYPMPFEIIKKMRGVSHIAKYRDLFDVLTLTGARSSEIQFLKWSDVVLTGDHPYFKIAPNDTRTVKSASSIRLVPLTAKLLEIFQRLYQRRFNDFVFGDVGTMSNKSVSNVLNHHLRNITSDKKIVIYSLRHSLTDYLRVNGVSQTVEDLLLGHAVDAVSLRVYGSGEGRVKQLHQALGDVMAKYAKEIFG